jgi:hypothetical protein
MSAAICGSTLPGVAPLTRATFTEIKEEKKAAANSRPWAPRPGNFLRISSQILSALFFEQKAASNLIPKRAAVRYLKKRVV